MDIDWGNLWNQGKTEVEKAFDNAVQTGVPALQAGVESKAISWLQTQQKETQKTLQTNIQKQLADPSPSNPFAKALKDAGLGAGLQQYGPMILIAVAVVGVGGYLLMRK
jgi:hypothetical protein